MKVNTIEFAQRKKIGEWEWKDLTINISPEEDESLDFCLTRLEGVIDWRLQYPEREARYRQYQAELKSETCDKREQKEKWVAQFEERKAEMEAI